MIKIIRFPTKSERFRERIEMVLRNDNSAEDVVDFIDRFLRVMRIQMGEPETENKEEAVPPVIGFDIQNIEDTEGQEESDGKKRFYRRIKK